MCLTIKMKVRVHECRQIDSRDATVFHSAMQLDAALKQLAYKTPA